MKFKCPICKTILKFDGRQTDSKFSCTSCDASFKTESVLRLAKAASKDSPRHDDTPTGAPVAPTKSLPQTDVGAIDTSTIDTRKRPIKPKKYSRSKQRVLAIVFLTLATIGLLISLVYVLQATTDTPATMNRDTASGPAEDAVDDNEFPSDDTLDSDPALPTTPINLPPFAELDEPGTNAMVPRENFLKSNRTLKNCWFRMQPHLVELRAETPLGTQYSTGMIVDSRGWVMTSYRSVQGATKISVRLAQRSVESSDQVGERLVDDVRGVLASSPEHDLVLLAINRRLVTSLDEVVLDDQEQLVETQYLIQCCPPTRLFPQATSETSVLRRFTRSQLGNDEADRLTRRGHTDDTVNWIAHQHAAPLRFGAPLCTDDGRVLGMNTQAGGAANTEVLAVPAETLTALLATASPQPAPLPLKYLGGGSPRPIDSNDSSQKSLQDDDLNVVAIGSDLRTFSESLNRTGAACQDFGWWTTQPSEAQQLREFLKLFVQISDRIEHAASPADAAELHEQRIHWQQQMERFLGTNSVIEPDAQLRFNEQFGASFFSRRVFIGYAFVHYSAMESPSIAIDSKSEKDSVVFQFKGLDIKVIGNLKDEWPPLRPDSAWLILGESVGGRVTLMNRRRQEESLQPAKIHFVMPADL